MLHPSHGYSNDLVSSIKILFFCINPSLRILTSGRASHGGSVIFPPMPRGLSGNSKIYHPVLPAVPFIPVYTCHDENRHIAR
jgi:hypothetical protein